jgi:hypothetical protein
MIVMEGGRKMVIMRVKVAVVAMRGGCGYGGR